MIKILTLALSTLLCIPAVAAAETIALSADQIEAAKEAGAQRHAREAALGIEPILQAGNRDRQIHGEVGVTVGTGGYREIYGTAVAPLGETGVLAVSIAQARGDRYYDDRGYGYPGYGYQGYGYQGSYRRSR